MTIICALEAIILLAVVQLLMRHHSLAEKAWTDERRELVSRIQAPHHIPLSTGDPFVFPEPEPDELELVGTIADPPEES